MRVNVPYLHRLYPDNLAPVILVPDYVFEGHYDPNTAVVWNATKGSREFLNVETGELRPSVENNMNSHETTHPPLHGSQQKISGYAHYCFIEPGNLLFEKPPDAHVEFLNPFADRYCMLSQRLESSTLNETRRDARNGSYWNMVVGYTYTYTCTLSFRDGYNGKRQTETWREDFNNEIQTIDLLEVLGISPVYADTVSKKNYGLPIVSISYDGSTVLYVCPQNDRQNAYLLWDLSDPTQWKDVATGNGRVLSIGSVPAGKSGLCATALSDDGQTLYLTTGEFLYTQTIATSQNPWVQIGTSSLIQSVYSDTADIEYILPTSVSLVRTSSLLFVSVHFTSRLRIEHEGKTVDFKDYEEQCDYLYGPDSIGQVRLRRLPAANRYRTLTRGHQLLIHDVSGCLGIQGQSSQFRPPTIEEMVTGTVSDEGAVSVGLLSVEKQAGDIPTPSTRFQFSRTVTEGYTASPNGAFVVGWDGIYLTIYSGCLHSGAYYHLSRTGLSEHEWIQSMDAQLKDIHQYCQWLGTSDPRCSCLNIDALRKEMRLEDKSYNPYKDLVPCLVGRCRTLSSETILGDYFHQQRDCGPLQLCFQEISVTVIDSKIGGDIMSNAACGSLFGVPTPDKVPEILPVTDSPPTDEVPEIPPIHPDWTWAWILGACLAILCLVLGIQWWRTYRRPVRPDPIPLSVENIRSSQIRSRKFLSGLGSTQRSLAEMGLGGQ